MNKTNAIIILDIAKLQPEFIKPLQQQLEPHVNFVAPPHNAQMILDHPDILQDVEVIFCSWGMVKLDQKLLDHAPNLKAVFYAAGSIRYFTTPAFWRRGIQVTSAYHVNGEYVANFTLAQILLSLKRYWQHTREYQQHKQTWKRIPIAGMYKSKIGLISLGAIGRKVVELLQPFDVEILAYDPFWTQEQVTKLGVTLIPELDSLFKQCDVISLHTPWLPETEGMITGSHILSMKPGATFINTARGAVVREDEMIATLEKRSDLTALLDVTYPEPPEPDSKLFSLPNIILSPHIAGAMNDEILKMGVVMIAEFLRWKNDQPMEFEISEEKAKTLA